jgi:G:T-mismatch repair DNA endonuclease (very short patch repair protein)
MVIIIKLKHSFFIFFEIKFRLWYEHKLDPEWLESIPYYEFQIWLEKLNKAIEAKNAELQSEDGKKQVFSFTK